MIGFAIGCFLIGVIVGAGSIAVGVLVAERAERRRALDDYDPYD